MTNMMRFAPSRELRGLQQEIDRVFDGFFERDRDEEGRSAVWTPRVDLAESEDSYLVHLDVPGVDKDNIELNYHDGTLTVSGERTAEHKDEGTNFVRVERSYGHFYRSFSLPKAADPDNIEASCDNGVLTIRVPKTPESKPRRIEVG